MISRETSNHAFDSILELAILCGVDERIDAAVDEPHHQAELVEPENYVLFLKIGRSRLLEIGNRSKARK